MKYYVSIAMAAAVAFAAPAFAATSVAANQASTTDLGFFAAGTYTISASGLVDMVGPPGSGFTIRPDGTPDSPVTTPGYADFNPDGAFFADGAFGPGGTTARIGALMGSLSSAPSALDWFLIGFGKTITMANAGHIYAQVNDTAYANNGGAFIVEVSQAVPEPAAWAMMIGGFILTGAAMRRRRMVVRLA